MHRYTSLGDVKYLVIMLKAIFIFTGDSGGKQHGGGDCLRAVERHRSCLSGIPESTSISPAISTTRRISPVAGLSARRPASSPALPWRLQSSSGTKSISNCLRRRGSDRRISATSVGWPRFGSLHRLGKDLWLV